MNDIETFLDVSGRVAGWPKNRGKFLVCGISRGDSRLTLNIVLLKWPLSALLKIMRVVQ
jgi:hypothetical protein